MQSWKRNAHKAKKYKKNRKALGKLPSKKHIVVWNLGV
jgi:hypothetical protein